MTKLLTTLVLAGAATAAGVAAAPAADAAPTSAVHAGLSAHRRTHVGFGIGIGTGGYGYAVPSGYWTTQTQWVPQTVLVGYGVNGAPIYETRYVAQTYQVWVPTVSYVSRPAVSFGLGFRFR